MFQFLLRLDSFKFCQFLSLFFFFYLGSKISPFFRQHIEISRNKLVQSVVIRNSAELYRVSLAPLHPKHNQLFVSLPHMYCFLRLEFFIKL